MMTSKNPVSNIAPETVLDFLHHTLPFNELDDQALRELARHCIIDFIPKGVVIFRQGETQIEHLYLIQKGGVKLYLEDDHGQITLSDFRGESEYFGALPIMQNTRANLNVATVEDTFCFLFPKTAFLKLLESSPKISHYFLRSLSEKLVNTAYAELRRHRISPRSESALYLFSTQVGTAIKGQLQTIAAEASVRQAAAKMSEKMVGSLLVTNPTGKIIGIVTDKDLRTKVVAAGLDYQTQITTIMASPVQTIPAHAVCFDAMLRMVRQRIHHLAVEKQGEIVGMVTSRDIMLLQGTSPFYLFREIVAERTLKGLHSLAHKVQRVVRSLIEEGAKADNITKMITVLNDRILERLLTLLIEELGPPPLPFCWLMLGSEGRSEQIFKADQDNALIYAEAEDQAKMTSAAKYFENLSVKAVDNLVQCGYPLCRGEIMASNPKWRKSTFEWQKTFDAWISKPKPQDGPRSTIFFDFRPGYGDFSLADQLRQHLIKSIPNHGLFLYLLAKNALEAQPPLSFFRNFIVEKNGEHRNSLNIKANGLLPIVDFARLFALKNGIRQSNTLSRLQVLHERGQIKTELYDETVKAYEFLMQLRLVHQLHQTEEGRQPDNYINPSNISDLEKQTLKESFAVVSRLQHQIKLEFRLSEH